MITGDDYENKDMPFFFCPTCGLPNDLSTFYCFEVQEKAHQMAAEWAMKEINQKLGKSIKSINKSGFVKMDLIMPKHELEKEWFIPVEEYVIHKTPCCQMSIKLREIDEQIGAYCPIWEGKLYEKM